MKKILIFVCALSTVLCCVLPAFADPGNSDDPVAASPIIETVETPAGQTVTVTMAPVIDRVQPSEDTGSSLVSRTIDYDNFVPEDGLPGLVYRIFGYYCQPLYQEEWVDANGTVFSAYTAVPGLAGLDWYWLTGVGLFALVLWSFFRFLGVVLKRG